MTTNRGFACVFASVVAILSLALLGGCSEDRAYAVRGQSYAGDADPAAEKQPLEESLFKEDQAVMSNQDLTAVLSADVRLPAHGKLAVVRFGQLPYWWGWSEDVVRMNRDADQQFLARLRQSPRLKSAIYLPSLVT